MTTASPPVAETQVSGSKLRLGSFELGRRIDERPYGRPSVVATEALGAAGTPFENRDAIVRCFPIGMADPAIAARVEEASARLRAVAHRALVPVLEAAVAGDVAFVAEARPDGIPLSQVLAEGGKLTPIQVKRVLDDVSAGLAAAHRAGLRHGRVTPANIWLGNNGSAAIGGFVCGDPGGGSGASDPWRPAEESKAALDQYQLSLTAATALTGSIPAVQGGVPESLTSVPASVVAVLRRGTAPVPEHRYPDLYAFAQAFGEAIDQAGGELIAGVWEATSRNDTAMAAIMLEMAEAYAPNHQDLGLLRLRTGGGTVGNIAELASVGLPTSSAGHLPSPWSIPPSPPATAEEAAIAALLTPPRPAAVPRRRSNPWVAFAAGTFACVVLLVLVAALAFASR